MNKILILVLMILLSTGLTGCALPVQPPVDISHNFWQEKDKTIGVIMSEIPEPETTIVGASCLLCYGVASAANSSLDKHLKTIPTEDVAILKQKVFDILTDREMNVTMLEQDIAVGKNSRRSSIDGEHRKIYTAWKIRRLVRKQNKHCAKSWHMCDEYNSTLAECKQHAFCMTIARICTI